MIISKLDAATNQLQTAIGLFFEGGDPISIHTLATAAHELFLELAKKEGEQSILKGYMLTAIKPEHHKQVIDALNTPRNFFKHADKDINATIEFKPDATGRFLRDAIYMHDIITERKVISLRVYDIRFKLHHTSIFPTLSKDLEKSKKLATELGYLNNKKIFYKEISQHI